MRPAAARTRDRLSWHPRDVVRNLITGLAGLLVLGILVMAIGNAIAGPRAAVPSEPAATDTFGDLTSPSAVALGTTDSPTPVATVGPRSAAGLPNPRLTPGSINPAVTPATLESTICHRGWTATIRPPAAYTSALKLVQIVRYGYRDRNPRDYQEDHLVPLELGGAPRDPKNLWPEPNTATLSDGASVGSAVKDGFENTLNHEVCDGILPLAQAQRMIAGDWVAAWEASRP